jgi:hypothetical protein
MSEAAPPRSHHHARGTFKVSLTPQPLAHADDAVAVDKFARMAISKQFVGELEGTSVGEMLSMMGEVKGSAAYVAIERVSGVLHGRRGSLALQHMGTMDRGAPTLAVRVVPDSGTEALSGIAGELSINIVGGEHFYELHYSLPA